jgi:hypothetical protein
LRDGGFDVGDDLRLIFRAGLWASASLLAACGGSAPATTAPAAAVDPHDVRLEEDASVGELVGALKQALIAGGHEGECFLAWDVTPEEGGEQLTVHVGERTRSAAVSCHGLDPLSRSMQGRCPFVRFFWVSGEAMHTEAMTFYFAPAGRAYAARAIGAGHVEAPASDAVFQEEPEGTQLVLGIPVRERADGAGKQDEPMVAGPEDDPLTDPEVMSAVQQLVARVQTCNPEGQGSLVLEWLVEPDGRIAQVMPLTSSVSDDARECAVEVMSHVSFPEHGGDHPIDYCVPVLLDPSLRPSSERPVTPDAASED